MQGPDQSVLPPERPIKHLRIESIVSKKHLSGGVEKRNIVYVALVNLKGDVIGLTSTAGRD